MIEVMTEARIIRPLGCVFRQMTAKRCLTLVNGPHLCQSHSGTLNPATGLIVTMVNLTAVVKPLRITVKLGASEQQSVITTECNEVVNDEHKSEDSGDLTVNYMSPGPDGPAQ